MKSKPIVVVGSLNLGANQAVAAARLGNEVCMIGCVGSDAYGQRQRMQSHGVDLSAAAIVDSPSGVA